MASFNKAAIAPTAFKSPAVTGLSSYVYATIIFDKRSLRSDMPFARQKTAIISLATVIS